jgi:hypothetical protein
MELDDFGGAFAPGFALSIEERAALETHLAKRRIEEKLVRFVPDTLAVIERQYWMDGLGGAWPCTSRAAAR